MQLGLFNEPYAYFDTHLRSKILLYFYFHFCVFILFAAELNRCAYLG